MDNKLLDDCTDNVFLSKVEKYLSSSPAGRYCVAAINIEHFRIFNKIYSVEISNDLINKINEYLNAKADEYGTVVGYMGADNFAMLLPFSDELFDVIRDDIINIISEWSNTIAFYPMIGVYVIEDTSVRVKDMYDRAVLAITDNNDYNARRVRFYSSDIEKNLEEEIKLIYEIQQALNNNEFTFFAQPQCNIVTGKIVGAEALVRWIKPDGTFVSPGVFIPVLESYCMIDQLDRYVWDKVCAWLRSWIDKGYDPVPISINVSRIDILSMDVVGYVSSLLEKYNLDEHLLKIEITESAYIEQNDIIQSTVKVFRDKGFKVMMDDFGSGYSSLNMLKNIPVDVLKLDMRFLEINDSEEIKGLNILESVVNMARLLRLPIVVEGVETKKQEQFILSLGCRYIQGYYMFKPLPVNKFEELLSDEDKLDRHGLLCKQVEPLHIREFIDRNFLSDSMLNNIMGPVAFYEIDGDSVKIIRVNEQYSKLVGAQNSDGNNYGVRFWNHVHGNDRQILLNIFEDAYNNISDGGDGYIHFTKNDGTVILVYMRAFFLKETNGCKEYYGSLVDMTDYHEEISEDKSTDVAIAGEDFSFTYEELDFYYGNHPYGFCISKVILDKAKRPVDYEIVYTNNNLKMICDGNLSRLHDITSYKLGSGNESATELMYNAAFKGEQSENIFYSHISNRYYRFTHYQFKPGYASTLITDITSDYIYKKSLKTIMHVYRDVYYVNLVDNYYNALYLSNDDATDQGNYEEAIDRHFFTGKIVDEDEETIRKFLSIENIKTALTNSDTTQLVYKRLSPDGRVEWCMTSFVVSERDKRGNPEEAVCVIRNIDDIIKGSKDNRASNLNDILSSISEGFFIYRADNEDLLFANSGVLNLFGCDSYDEFKDLTKNNFCTMLHPDDINRVHAEIQSQIVSSTHNMDYIRYRIIRKDGSVRWVEDYGHLENANRKCPSGYYYVFIADITDTITESQKKDILRRNKQFN